MQIFDGALPSPELLKQWYELSASKGTNGAFVSFVGVVRNEGGISGLSFDIYEPILKKWLDTWHKKANALGAEVFFAHSRGDVAVGQSSYATAIISPKRRVALELIDEFVEDFKANAPIWKYDIIDGKRIYASSRSTPLVGAGLLA